MTNHVVHVSNRVDIPVVGKATAGGLDEAVARAPKGYLMTRFGWSGTVIPDSEYNAKDSVKIQTVNDTRYIVFDYNETMKRGFYDGTSGDYLWPLCHYRADIARRGFSVENNAVYDDANVTFVELLLPYIEPHHILISHDNHLIPQGREFEKRGVNNPKGFYLHTPAPGVELLEEFDRPQQLFLRSLLSNLYAYDLVGLQTRRDFTALASILDKSAGMDAPKPFEPRIIPDLSNRFNRETSFGVFPAIGVIAEYAKDAAVWENRKETKDFMREQGIKPGVRRIVSVDRMDFSKGIPNKFIALGILHRKGTVNEANCHFLQVAPVGSRDARAYHDELAQAQMGHNMLTSIFGQNAATLHTEKVLRQKNLGMFRNSDVGLVTPLRDGQNFVAFEYIAAQNPDNPGVLVLSKFAGAAERLKDAAVLVDPYDPEDIARGIAHALSLPLEQRKALHAKGMAVANEYTNDNWQLSLIEATVKAAKARVGSLSIAS